MRDKNDEFMKKEKKKKKRPGCYIYNEGLQGRIASHEEPSGRSRYTEGKSRGNRNRI